MNCVCSYLLGKKFKYVWAKFPLSSFLIPREQSPTPYVSIFALAPEGRFADCAGATVELSFIKAGRPKRGGSSMRPSPDSPEQNQQTDRSSARKPRNRKKTEGG
jgi:hypothetical protein